MENIFDKIAKARSMTGARFPSLDNTKGVHTLAVVNFYMFKTQDQGDAIAIEAMVAESDTLNPGDIYSKAFFVNRPKYPEYEQADARNLFEALTGYKAEEAGREAHAALSDPKASPSRGVLVKAVCSSRPDKKNPSKAYTDIAWAHVDGQTPEGIRAARLEIESAMPPNAFELPDRCVLPPGVSAPVQTVQTTAPQTRPSLLGKLRG